MFLAPQRVFFPILGQPGVGHAGKPGRGLGFLLRFAEANRLVDEQIELVFFRPGLRGHCRVRACMCEQ